MSTESQARRAAKKAGYRVVKSRQREHGDNMGGLQLVDSYANAVVLGVKYDLTPDDVMDFLAAEQG
jgi:hypothetical protein